MSFPRFSFRIAVSLLVLGGVMGMSASSVFAVESPPTTGARTEACLSQFSVFITTLLSFDDSKDYFQDLFERNRCQQDDIFALDSQIDSKMKTLRGMYFDRCASPEITQLQEAIRELKMEQYFIRHIVPVAEDSTYKRDAAALEADFDSIKFALFLDMTDRFVTKKKWLTEAELEALMTDWLDSYQDRIDEYVDCSSSPWQEVADKWKKFQEGVKELSEFSKGKSKSSQTRDKDAQAEKEEREQEAGTSAAGEKDSGGTSVPGFLKKMFTLRLNGVDSERGVKQLFADVKKNGEVLSLGGAQSAAQLEIERYQREVSMAELLATYDLLYGQGSADITNDLVTRLQSLRSTIDGTTKGSLHALIESAKGIHSKQGKTSPK